MGHAWSVPVGTPFQVSLVQPSIPQTLKWDPARRRPTLETYRRLTETQAAHSALVIWPETAVPDFLHRVEDQWLLPLAQELASRGARLLIGVPVLDPAGEHYYNAAVVVGPLGEAYFKRHLVPFGEFLPLERWLGPLLDFLKIPMSHFSAGRAAHPTLQVGDRTAGVSICYEDAFGEEVREALPMAAYLVNLSNDAWFGDSLAPYQHLQIARMRALETGRPLLRATNSGISALIGPQGELQARTPTFTKRVLSGPVQPMSGETPFVRWGNWAALTLMWLGLAGGLLRRPWRRRT
jgi:apolipoprotein N-acyltransferase